MTDDPLDRFHPKYDELLNIVFSRVDDSMLEEIAEADYGWNAVVHLAALLKIRSGVFPAPMLWEPKETLELIRWSEPDQAAWKPGSTGERGHWMRLFACAALIRAGAEPENEGFSLGEESTIIQLVESAMTLGKETSLAAIKFLSARFRTLAREERPFYALAILLLAIASDQCDTKTERFLMQEVDAAEFDPSDMFGMCIREEKWRAFIRRLLIAPASASHERRRFGKMLIGDASVD